MRTVEQMSLTNFFMKFTDKLNLKNPYKNMVLANLSIYYAFQNFCPHLE